MITDNPLAQSARRNQWRRLAYRVEYHATRALVVVALGWFAGAALVTLIGG